MNKRLLFALLCFSAVVMACSKSDNKEKVCVDVCTDVFYDIPFSIVKDGMYCFPDDTQLTVKAFRNEFCPCEAVCVWQGQMVIEMEWADGSKIVDYEYFSDDNSVANSNLLPNGASITDEDTDIIYVTPCNLANGNPDITGAKILVEE